MEQTSCPSKKKKCTFRFSKAFRKNLQHCKLRFSDFADQYAIELYRWVSGYYAVAWKLAAGLGYGTVLGIVRLKTKNCYAAMLLHGVLNIFMV